MAVRFALSGCPVVTLSGLPAEGRLSGCRVVPPAPPEIPCGSGQALKGEMMDCRGLTTAEGGQQL